METPKIKNILVLAQMTDGTIRQVIVKEKINQLNVLNMIQRNNNNRIEVTGDTYDKMINWESPIDLTK